MLLPQHVRYVPPGSGTLCTGTAVVAGSMPSSGGEGGSASGAGSGSGAGSWSVAGPVWRRRCLRLRLKLPPVAVSTM